MNSTKSYYAQQVPLLATVNTRLNLWLPFVVLIPGFVLNVFTASVFMRKKFWNNLNSMGYYYTLRPLLSNIYIMATAINILTTVYYRDLSLISYGMCVFWFIVRLSSVIGAQYFAVQMTLNGAINILFPRRYMFLSKTRNLALITISMYLIMLIYAVCTQAFRMIVYRNITQNDSTTVISIPSACTYSSASLAVNNILFCLLRTLGFAINIIASIFIVKRIIESKANLGKRSSRISSKDYAFIFSLMWSNILQFLMSAPFMTVLFVQTVLALCPKAPADMVTYFNLLYSITLWGNSVYESLHFWINLSTNKLFKQELKRMFKLGRVEPASSRFDSSSIVNPNRTYCTDSKLSNKP